MDTFYLANATARDPSDPDGPPPSEPKNAQPPSVTQPVPPTGDGQRLPQSGLAAMGGLKIIAAAVILAGLVWGLAALGGKAKRSAYLLAFIILLSALILNVRKATETLRAFGLR